MEFELNYFSFVFEFISDLRVCISQAIEDRPLECAVKTPNYYEKYKKRSLMAVESALGASIEAQVPEDYILFKDCQQGILL